MIRSPHTRMYSHIVARAHTHRHTHIHTHTYTDTHTNIHRHTQASTHADTHKRAHTHTHTHIHKRALTHTHSQACMMHTTQHKLPSTHCVCFTQFTCQFVFIEMCAERLQTKCYRGSEIIHHTQHPHLMAVKKYITHSQCNFMHAQAGIEMAIHCMKLALCHVKLLPQLCSHFAF